MSIPFKRISLGVFHVQILILRQYGEIASHNPLPGCADALRTAYNNAYV